MLRLALAATLMYSATALTYEGDVMTLFSNYLSSVGESAEVCGSNSDGTTAGPVTAGVNHNGARPIVLGECYGTGTAAVLPMGYNHVSHFAAESATDETFIIASATEVKWALSTAGTDVEMIGYTGTADDCTANAVTAETHGVLNPGTGAAGWACRDQDGSNGGDTVITDSILDKANSAKGLVKTVKYVTVNNYTNATQNTNDCSTTIGSVAGRIVDYWPVAANDADAILGTCATATTAATHTANEVACVAASANWTAGLGGAAGDHTLAHWALCYDDGTGSWQAQCDLETGDIIMTSDADGRHCTFAVNQVVNRFTKTNKGALFDSGNKSMCIANSDTEWDAICSFPAHTATAKYFKGYFLATAGDCATQTAALSATAAENDGTRDVFIGVCYTLESDGEMAGWQGPFVTGGTGSEPIAAQRSYKFVEGTTDIELYAYTTHDCSGALTESLTKYATDDPASPSTGTDEWPCQAGSVISHGGIATTGNIAMLQTATNYLVVRRYTEASANGVGLPGKCTGGHATTKVNTAETSGLINDYFRVGTSAADGCHQMTDGASTTVTVAQGYSWWCDTSDGSINYGTFHTADCSASQLGGALRFTKKSYTACSEADAADTTTTCTAAGPTTVLENPSAFVFATVTTSANGAAAAFGGKCLEQATNVSWGILTDDTTWDSICSVPTTATTTTTTSGAGKIAATAAAAAAAAALLL